MKNLCVYCGSSAGNNATYIECARQLGMALVARNIGLVYGGASVGIMGGIADAVLAAGGTVVGVIPAALAKKEVAHDGLSQMHVVPSMHERKALMTDLADGFVALPGGLGTIEEIFEILTWTQLGFHQKPCGFLNVLGYYDKLSEFLDHTVSEGFVKPVHREMILMESEPAALIAQFLRYTAPRTDKWIDRDQI